MKKNCQFRFLPRKNKGGTLLTRKRKRGGGDGGGESAKERKSTKKGYRGGAPTAYDHQGSGGEKKSLVTLCEKIQQTPKRVNLDGVDKKHTGEGKTELRAESHQLQRKHKKYRARKWGHHRKVPTKVQNNEKSSKRATQRTTSTFRWGEKKKTFTRKVLGVSGSMGIIWGGSCCKGGSWGETFGNTTGQVLGGYGWSLERGPAGIRANGGIGGVKKHQEKKCGKEEKRSQTWVLSYTGKY